MQALCQWDVLREENIPSLREWLSEQESPEPVATSAAQLVIDFWSRQVPVDAAISAAATNWRMERMSLVERNLLRISTTELMLGETPVKVVLNEAIEIGREFGGAETPAFLNGVLDQVAKGIAASA